MFACIFHYYFHCQVLFIVCELKLNKKKRSIDLNAWLIVVENNINLRESEKKT